MLLVNEDVMWLTLLVADTSRNPHLHDEDDHRLAREVRNRAPSQWWTTLGRLQDGQNRGVPCKGAIQFWTQFGGAVGLSSESEAKRLSDRSFQICCSNSW